MNMKAYNDVYKLLEDEESRDIWINRLNYLITDDYRYIERIVDRYCYKAFGGMAERDALSRGAKEEVIFYGAGERVSHIRIPDAVTMFCDRDARKQAEGFRGYRVISFEELAVNHRRANIVITSERCYEEIRASLLEKKFEEKQIHKFYTLPERQYFDEPFIQFGENEVFVDAGAYDLSTTLEFAKRCANFRRIYAFEPDKVNLDLCHQRKNGNEKIQIVPYGTWSSKGELKFKALGNWSSKIDEGGNQVIPVTTLEDVVEDKVTYIKMDVEGAELETLKGAKCIIQRDKPRLAVCIYHKPEDMVELPLYIKSLVPEYKLYVRHYSEEKYETVLYAVTG